MLRILGSIEGASCTMEIKTLYSSAVWKATLGKIKPNCVNMIIINKQPWAGTRDQNMWTI